MLALFHVERRDPNQSFLCSPQGSRIGVFHVKQVADGGSALPRIAMFGASFAAVFSISVIRTARDVTQSNVSVTSSARRASTFTLGSSLAASRRKTLFL